MSRCDCSKWIDPWTDRCECERDQVNPKIWPPSTNLEQEWHPAFAFAFASAFAFIMWNLGIGWSGQVSELTLCIELRLVPFGDVAILHLFAAQSQLTLPLSDWSYSCQTMHRAQSGIWLCWWVLGVQLITLAKCSPSVHVCSGRVAHMLY